jgi:diguanylate cyclase (GGDEF)-like protein/PAS domain S-box-containing protein
MSDRALRILLIEDNRVDACLLQLLLEKSGGAACQIEVAGLLATGLERLAAGGLDLVLLDLGLPDSCGLATFLALQASAPHVPIIVLSGMDDQDLATQAVAAGAQDYLIKGRLDGDQILRSARYAIERARLLDREQTEHAATKTAERRFRELLESIDAILWEMDLSTWSYSFVSRRAEEILGYPVEKWLSTPGFLLAHMHPDDRDRMIAISEELLAGAARSFEVRVFAADGSVVWLLGSVTEADRTLGVATGLMVDVTARKMLELLEREQSAILAMVAQSLPMENVLAHVTRLVENQCAGSLCCVFLLRQGRLTFGAGPSLMQDFRMGLESQELVLEDPDRSLRDLVLNGDLQQAAAWQPCRELAQRCDLVICASTPILSVLGEPEGLIVVHCKQDEPRVQIPEIVLNTAARLVALLVAHASLEARLSHQAQHDALTDLPNRALLEDRLSQALLRARRQQQSVAVLFIDLDGFKAINDTRGHGAGDELLRWVATCLQSVMRRSDTLARLGGDEFVAVLSGIHDSQDAGHVAQLLLSSLSSPFNLQGHEIHTTASIGISFYPDDAMDIVALQSHADAAMYLAKASGRNCFKFYTAELNAQLTDRIELEDDLRRAIARGELLLHYQPLYRADATLMGFEALVRWDHPVRGMILPARFIPLAEESGLIHALGRWVLEQACHQCVGWRAAGRTDLRMAVNVSALQFQHEDWVNIVAETLARTGLDPAGLELELTEGIVMQQVTDSVSRLRAIKALGVAIAIDDFGTGYSSLAYLQRLPIDTLKIDQSFVFNLEPEHGGQNSAPVVEAIVTLARGLGLRVLAEGVETEGQLAILRRMGCHAMQGYYFGSPVTSEECLALLS